ncbi:MAG: hypothetical protein K2K20_12420 [Lachnospiraceae bacterium]|nr:hypothetical protein [Lachnospiraceae bacterium]
MKKKRGLENKRHRETEPDFSKKGFRWKFPLGPGKTLLTLLCICILALSLSADVAWLIGYQYMIYFLYIGAFSTTLMLMIDISSLHTYWKSHRSMKKKEQHRSKNMENDIEK